MEEVVRRNASRLLLAAALVSVAVPAYALEPKKPSQIVTLVESSESCTLSPGAGLRISRRILPDGTEQPFEIPNGQVFVVTRVGYSAHTGTALDSGELLFERDGAPWWFARLPVVFAANGTATGLVEVHAVIGAGGQVCIRGQGPPAVTVDHGSAEGYLTKAK
jgi:hypothetical protein